MRDLIKLGCFACCVVLLLAGCSASHENEPSVTHNETGVTTPVSSENRTDGEITQSEKTSEAAPSLTTTQPVDITSEPQITTTPDETYYMIPTQEPSTPTTEDPVPTDDPTNTVTEPETTTQDPTNTPPVEETLSIKVVLSRLGWKSKYGQTVICYSPTPDENGRQSVLVIENSMDRKSAVMTEYGFYAESTLYNAVAASFSEQDPDLVQNHMILEYSYETEPFTEPSSEIIYISIFGYTKW